MGFILKNKKQKRNSKEEEEEEEEEGSRTNQPTNKPTTPTNLKSPKPRKKEEGEGMLGWVGVVLFAPEIGRCLAEYTYNIIGR